MAQTNGQRAAASTWCCSAIATIWRGSGCLPYLRGLPEIRRPDVPVDRDTPLPHTVARRHRRTRQGSAPARRAARSRRPGPAGGRGRRPPRRRRQPAPPGRRAPPPPPPPREAPRLLFGLVLIAVAAAMFVRLLPPRRRCARSRRRARRRCRSTAAPVAVAGSSTRPRIGSTTRRWRSTPPGSLPTRPASCARPCATRAGRAGAAPQPAAPSCTTGRWPSSTPTTPKPP